MWPSRSIITEKNNKGLVRKVEIRLNSKWRHKPSDKGFRPLTPEARENPKHLPAHVFGVALKGIGPVHVLNPAARQGQVPNASRRVTGRWTAPLPLKVEGLSTPTVHPS
jgi:hypothetical protein